MAALLCVFAVSVTGQSSAEETPFPENYRSWTHVKSEVVLPGHRLAAGILGIHHIYANDEALKGYKTGEWRDGAVIVFDLLSYDEIDSALVEGARKQVDVMVRSADRFSETGSWGYEEFVYEDGGRRRAGDMAAQCHGCHALAEGDDFVFSALRP